MEAAVLGNDAQALVNTLTNCINNSNNDVIIIDDNNDNNNEINNVNDNIDRMHQLKELLQKSITIITKNCNDMIKAAASKASASASGESDTYLVLEEAQFVEPRGKFKATISKVGLFLEGKQASLFINWNNFARSACIPSSSTSKKEGEDILVFVLSEPLKMNNKDICNFQWILNKSEKKLINIVFDSNAINGTEAAIIPKLVRKLTNKSIDVPRPAIFTSKTKDRPYLLCYKGIQEGAVYLMKSGVIFVKPLLYIPFNEIASVSAGRGGTQATTRYVDLIIETADERQYEFTNIERDDLPAMNNYVKNYLEERIKHENAMIKQNDKEANNEEENDDDDDDDSDEDEDFDPDNDEDGGSDNDDDDSKKDSDDETADEDVENTKPPQKESRKAKNPKKKDAKDTKKDIKKDSNTSSSKEVKKESKRKNKSPKKLAIHNNGPPIPKNVVQFVNLLDDEMNIKRSAEIDLVDDDDEQPRKEPRLMG